MKITVPIFWFAQDTDNSADAVLVFSDPAERFAAMVACVRSFELPDIADAMEAQGMDGEWVEIFGEFTAIREFDNDYFNWGDAEMEVEVPVAASPFQPAPGACVAKLHGDGQVTITAPFAAETMEEATIRIARKLEAHRWDLSVLSASERAILSRP